MRILLLLAGVALLLRLGVFGWLHSRYRSVHPGTDTVSDYGTGPSRPAYTVMAGLSAAAYGLIAIALWGTGYQPRWLSVLLSVAAVSSAVILWFPTDRTGSGRRTRTGLVHWLLAIANFTLIFVFISNAAVPGTSAPAGLLSGLAVLLWATRVSFYAFVLTLVIAPLRRLAVGLTERLFLVCVPVWFIVFVVALVRS